MKKDKARYSILVMDDEETVRDVAKSMLDYLGHVSTHCRRTGRRPVNNLSWPKTQINLLI